MTNLCLATVVVSAAVVVPALRAQAPQPAVRQAFEVASIKRHDSSADRFPMTGLTQYLPGGRFRGTNIYIKALVLQAFRTSDWPLRTAQIQGGPGWLETDGYDINASLGRDGISTEEFLAQLPFLIRSLLEDRFRLKWHIEKRPQPVYVLLKARADGRLGPQLRPTTTDCDVYAREQRAAPRRTTPPVPNAPLPPCDSARLGPGSLSARGYAIRQLVNSLGTDRTNLDRTDLSGRFDIDLQWTTDPVRSGAQPPTGNMAADGPSIFTAVQEQLGLRLEAREELLDVLVIDSIERPTPD